MDKELKVYELIIDNEADDFVSAISFVENPAIEEDFLMFDKQEKFEFKVENEEERIVSGPALIFDKQIYRYNYFTGEEYYVYFSKQTVKDLAYNFLLNNRQNNVTTDHSKTVNGVKLIESWLSKQDNELGYGLPAGNWFTSYKVDNDEIWNKVKSGDFKGFSIEVYVGLKEDLSLIEDLSDEELDELYEKIKSL